MFRVDKSKAYLEGRIHPDPKTKKKALNPTPSTPKPKMKYLIP